MTRHDDRSDGAGDSAGGARTPNGQRVAGILLALLIAAVVVWVWNEFGRPGLKSLVEAVLRD